MNIFVNHIGYSPGERKRAVVEGAPELDGAEIFLIERNTGRTCRTIDLTQSGPVDRWKNWNFLTADFSSFTEPGQYFLILVRDGLFVKSETFKIAEDVLSERTVPDILFYLKSMRSTGNYDRKDRAVPLYGSDKIVDAHGGWYDASGDTSKYLSHLSYANFMNPQQIPMVGWNLLEALGDLKRRNKLAGNETEKRFVEEILQGADFVMRMQSEEGFFYMTLFDQWSKDLEKRMICSYSGQNGKRWESYQAGYRQGGGIAIALLARTAAMSLSGDFTTAEYKEAALRGFEHLEKHNSEYLDDRKENIIDDYCALLAASELYALCGESVYKNAAENRARRLIDRIRDDGPVEGWLSADGENRPYFHAVEAGLPVLSLIRFFEVTDREFGPMGGDVLKALKKIMHFELKVTEEVNNPFGYARQYIKAEGRESETAFFIPHENPSGYWWQGENARLASLAAAALKTARIFSEEREFSEELKEYAGDQIGWIVGCNPFNMSMLQGHGANNPGYEKDYPNNPGGIANGITSGFSDEHDIDFAPEGAGREGNHSWRWGEQWIPHAGWFLLAAALL